MLRHVTIDPCAQAQHRRDPSRPRLPRAVANFCHREFAMGAAHKALRRPDDLIAAGLLRPERRAEIEAVAARYALALTDDIVELIDAADPSDPVARQFIPELAELDTRP